MSFFKDVRSKLAQKEFNPIAPAQARALIDALTLTMVAEGEVQEVEETEVGRILDELGERTNFDVEAYLQESITSAKQAIGDQDAVDRKARDIAARLDDETLREEAYYLASRIAVVDIEVVSDETRVLQSLVAAFDIPRRRMALLTQRLRELL
ncbi:MAG: hypothetical protein ACLFVJ_13665 [Persicimonas sp.]